MLLKETNNSKQKPGGCPNSKHFWVHESFHIHVRYGLIAQQVNKILPSIVNI